MIPVKSEETGKDGKCTWMEEVFEDLDLHAGVSAAFERLAEVRNYYCQTVIVLQYLQEKKEKKSTLYFPDIAFEYTLKNVSGELKPQYLIPKELTLLHEGTEFGVEYWDTLKTYLDCKMNAAEASRELYVHRTTF